MSSPPSNSHSRSSSSDAPSHHSSNDFTRSSTQEQYQQTPIIVITNSADSSSATNHILTLAAMISSSSSHSTVLQLPTTPLQPEQLAKDAAQQSKMQHHPNHDPSPSSSSSSSSILWASEKSQSRPLPPQSWYGHLDRSPLYFGPDPDSSSSNNNNNRNGRYNHPYLNPSGPGSQHPFDDPIFRPPTQPLPGGGDDGTGRLGPGLGGGGGGRGRGRGGGIHTDPNDSLALLLPLLILLSSMLFFLLIFIILVILLRRRARIILSDRSGPLDIGREEELEGHGGLDGIEGRWLEGVEEAVARGYARAKEWVAVNPPASESTDITMSQSLAIQEKGVSAWSFDPDYEDNPSVFVVGRTELTFLADGQGMAAQEGGGNCVLSNLPLPKLNEVYYWEVKMFNKPDSTNVSIGLATKPYPCFRLPGWSKFSIGYFSQDGFKCHNYPFTAQSYGPSYVQGDVIGVGYRPRTGTVFFTRNGRKLEDAFVGLNRHNYFPCIGADGSAELHVNLGQAGFVFIEANVKKWGLAPSTGTLPPPPAYGMEQGSILIESGGQGSSSAGGAQSSDRQRGQRGSPTDVGDVGATAAVANAAIARRNALMRSMNNHPLPPAPAPAPASPPPPISPPPPLAHYHSSSSSSASTVTAATATPTPTPTGRGAGTGTGRRSHRSRRARAGSNREEEEDGDGNRSGSSPHNPPTPHELDISLHSLRSRRERRSSPGPPSYASVVVDNGQRERGSSLTGSRLSRQSHSHQQRSIDAADLLDAVGSTSSTQDGNGASIYPGLLIDTSSGSAAAASGPGATSSRPGLGSRASGVANAVLGMLTDRGLLTPMSAQDPTARSPGGSRVLSDGSSSSSPFVGIYGTDSPTASTGSGFLGGRTGTGAREERNSYFPTMSPAQQREQWDRERALLAEQQAAVNAAARGVSRSGSLSFEAERTERGGEGEEGR
ncbi:unnamed protein product [Tilletia laevis]|uniref:B30.2/SPRY domain-containing protein n=1 Tax=Tilletia laevis TaxID=157183 RepID=A0A9N8QA65_9BASI|nr:unnamed protein product [Tilletia laevis]